ncbi:MAG: hypothetical protein PHX76_01300 [Patescibacteria group bacterium]|nr:hypothetical protein [Patescibacteria group bacterium]NCU39607.1 hypothetical protein [Candidatus Falkowbacteria bacterium]
MRKWIILSVILISAASLLIFANPGKSRLKSYYSGDAISFNDQVYVSSTNTGRLEIFRLQDNRLDLVVSAQPYNARFNTYDDFYDAIFNIEGNRLYVYAVSNYTLYKYELTGTKLTLVTENKNTYWEWYNRVAKFGDDIVTISAKGIKVFSPNLEVIVAHDFNNVAAPYNLSGSNPRFYLSVDEVNSALSVYDREAREVVSTISLNFKYDKGNRRAYQDIHGNIFVVDDYYAKKFNVAGKLLASYSHLDFQGFDISGNNHSEYVYFSNGVGVVKLDKNMKEVDYAWTGNLGASAGWAMGIKSVYNNGDKLIVFNNTSILVLDDKLNQIASVVASEEADKWASENLFLKLDKNRAAVNSDIMISGGGYFPYEDLSITFGKEKYSAQADMNGRFSKIINVPQLRAGGHDIKVSGEESAFHYSISFQVE